MEIRKTRISGCGACVPEMVFTNEHFSCIVDTSDEWIVPRTGIRERRMIRVGEQASSDLAHAAARRALEMAEMDPADLQMIVVGTITPDQSLPNVACSLQSALGAKGAAAFDLSAACSGFVYALEIAKQFVSTASVDRVLAVGVDCMSTITDFEDRDSCILFGDGAGAAVVEPSDGEGEIFKGRLGAEGDRDLFFLGAGGSRRPTTASTVRRREHLLAMNGRGVFRFAVSKMQEMLEGSLKDNGFAPNDLRWIVPHQVNLRVIDSAIRKLDIPMDRVVVNIDRYGNTCAGSVPLALDEAVRGGRIQRGDLIALVALGAGLTWASTLVRW
jgi:3-oxoacyl-[acyl-carrier-protein] synthase-3